MANHLMQFGQFVVLFIMMTCTGGEDKMVSIAGVTVKVLGVSGKIYIYSGTNETDGVQIMFDHIKEIDTTGAAITGQSQHTVNNFASQEFTFTAEENTTFGTNQVPATKFSMSGSMTIDSNTVTLMSNFYIFYENGTIVVDGENQSVKSGDVKFDVKLESWPFCGTATTTCQQGQTTLTGQYLEFGMEMKERDDAGPAMMMDNIYTLGTSTMVIIPKQYTRDDTNTTDMVTDYPKLVTADNKTVVVLRFETFASSVMYDPIVALEGYQVAEVTTESPDVTTTPMTSHSMSENDINVNVMIMSGKINMSSDSKSLTVQFESLKEVTDTGDVIQTDGHAYSSFSNLNFTFGTMEMETMQDLNVSKLMYEVALDNSATFKVTLYQFKEAGNITNGNEVINVSRGTVKFSVEITGWTFCGDVTCTHNNTNEVGTQLDLELNVMGTKDSEMKNMTANEGKKYDLGSGFIRFFTQYKLDNAQDFTSMPNDYPTYRKQDSKQIFKMRFNKFSSNVLYDPVVGLNPSITENGSDHVISSMMSLVLLTLFHAIRKLFM